jgi:dihydroorotase
MKILFKNAQVVSASETSIKDVLVEDESIEKIADSIDVKADKEYDLTGKYLIPGVIDAHVHFRTPGYEAKEDWKTGSMAALAGGVTTVFDMPNTKPHTTTLKALEAKRALVAKNAMINYGFFFGGEADNLEDCKEAEGIVGFKVYMGATTGQKAVGKKDNIEDLLENLFENTDRVVAVHAEDEEIMRKHAEIYQGDHTPEVHSLIRNDEVAFTAAKKAIHLAKKYEGRMHICHMSTKKEVELMRKFGSDLITCEVTPHHLFLSIKDYSTHGNFVKVNPPIRGQHDQDVLWKAVQDGVINIVASDHAPHLREEKDVDYWKAPAGIPGVQTMLPLMLNAVNDEKLEIHDVVRLLSYGPSKLYGIQHKGAIREGYDADLVVVDMNFMHKVEDEDMKSKCGWSPFSDMYLKGWPEMTFVRGILGMENGRIIRSKELVGKEVDC